MKFPLLNISEPSWNDEDVIEFILFDEFIYTNNETTFTRYLKDKLFCDCRGDIFIVKDKVPPIAWWRKAFKFLPNTYKVKLIFQKTGEKISVTELKNYMIERVNGLSEDEFRSEWINYLKQAKSHEELIDGQMK